LGLSIPDLNYFAGAGAAGTTTGTVGTTTGVASRLISGSISSTIGGVTTGTTTGTGEASIVAAGISCTFEEFPLFPHPSMEKEAEMRQITDKIEINKT
jgi:hypothetical protein